MFGPECPGSRSFDSTADVDAATGKSLYRVYLEDMVDVFSPLEGIGNVSYGSPRNPATDGEPSLPRETGGSESEGKRVVVSRWAVVIFSMLIGGLSGNIMC